MPKRKSFLLRVPPELHEEIERWARDELRSVNAQIEFILRRAVQQHRGALKPPAEDPAAGTADAPEDDGG